MKKIALLFSVIILTAALLLSACGADDSDKKDDSDSKKTSTADQTSKDDPTEALKDENLYLTPYTYILLPEDYRDHVACEVVDEDPYTLDFKTTDGGVKLYSLVFDEEAEKYLGTMKTELGTIGIYANVPVLSEEEDDYDKLLNYQQELDKIVAYWEAECQFTPAE